MAGRTPSLEDRPSRAYTRLVTALSIALLLFAAGERTYASYRVRDEAKAHALAAKAVQIQGENPQGWCYLYVLRAMTAADILPKQYWKTLKTESAYQFAFGRRGADFPARFSLKLVPKYAPWKEGTIVVWNRDADGRHSCGRDTKLGKAHGHIEIVVDPRSLGRPERPGSYLSCFGMCGYTSLNKVNSYLRKGCIRVYEPSRLSS